MNAVNVSNMDTQTEHLTWTSKMDVSSNSSSNSCICSGLPQSLKHIGRCWTAYRNAYPYWPFSRCKRSPFLAISSWHLKVYWLTGSSSWLIAYISTQCHQLSSCPRSVYSLIPIPSSSSLTPWPYIYCTSWSMFLNVAYLFFFKKICLYFLSFLLPGRLWSVNRASCLKRF